MITLFTWLAMTKHSSNEQTWFSTFSPKLYSNPSPSIAFRAPELELFFMPRKLVAMLFVWLRLLVRSVAVVLCCVCVDDSIVLEVDCCVPRPILIARRVCSPPDRFWRRGIANTTTYLALFRVDARINFEALPYGGFCTYRYPTQSKT